MFDFDTYISRAATHAEKYTALGRLFGREDLLPFWVADMEFPVAPAIREALAARLQHPVYGYTSLPPSLAEAVSDWNHRRHGLILSTDAMVMVPGVMAGVSAALLALSEPGDAVVVQPPLYPPLMHTVRNNNRRLVQNHLRAQNGRYEIDFAELERLLQQCRPRVMLFCSPHNPGGRVWGKEEIYRLIKLLARYDVYLVSDEIHADIVFPPHKHIPVLGVSSKLDNRVIMLNSASKSFNVAGLNTAYALVPDLKLRTIFRRQLRSMNLHGVNLFGMIALEAAYREGEEWLDALLGYLLGNRRIIEETVKKELSGVRGFIPEGTYLYWLDFTPLGFDAEEIRKRLIDGAGVALNDGITFSERTGGYWRFNFGVPRTMLVEGLERIIRAFQ